MNQPLKRTPLPTHDLLNAFFEDRLNNSGQLISSEDDYQFIKELDADYQAEQQSRFERLSEQLFLRH